MDKEGVNKERMRRCRLVESVSLSISWFPLNCLAARLQGSSGMRNPAWWRPCTCGQERPRALGPQSPRTDKNLNEEEMKVEDQTSIILTYKVFGTIRDKHCGEHQYRCEVHSDHCPKEERLEEVGRTDDRIENNCWKMNCQNCPKSRLPNVIETLNLLAFFRLVTNARKDLVDLRQQRQSTDGVGNLTV